jgi:hypothetical protein
MVVSTAAEQKQAMIIMTRFFKNNLEEKIIHRGVMLIYQITVL